MLYVSLNTELDINILPTNPKANYEDGVIAGNVTAVSFFYKKKRRWGQEDENGWRCTW